jgi:hypothetical protein
MADARQNQSGGKYQRGYTTFGYGVTGGHAREAEEAERAKKPSRLGVWVLRKLGYKGHEPEQKRQAPHHGAPHHPKSPHTHE